MSMYGPPAGAPFGPPAAPKKGVSTGCIVAIAAVCLFFASVGGVVLFIGYKISTNKDVQHVMGAIGDAAQIMADAQAAPGTNELRALGCEQAMAIDAAKMQKLGSSFMDAGAPTAPPEVERIVMCQVGAFGTPPACDDAAKAYVRGAAPSGKFMLSVSSNKRQKCGGVYSPGATLLTPM
jgi:hypothetical protein